MAVCVGGESTDRCRILAAKKNTKACLQVRYRHSTGWNDRLQRGLHSGKLAVRRARAIRRARRAPFDVIVLLSVPMR